MADTIQAVSWALGQACALRSGEAVQNPVAARIAVGKAQFIVECANGASGSGSGIWGDVAVTGFSVSGFRGFGEIDLNRSALDMFAHRYPHSGFVISQEFGAIGGIEGLKSMCSACPANAAAKGEPAQCAGSLYLERSDASLEQQLKRAISRLRIGDDIESHFTPTKPTWYGLWTQSPLSTRAVRTLGKLFRGMIDDEMSARGVSVSSPSDVARIRAFSRAAEVAERREVPLFVSMAPPGHTDFGVHTIFPHCPLCKAEAQVERWQRKYPEALRACEVCGTVYSPAKTAKSESMDDDDDDDRRGELRAILGQSRFVALAKEYLRSQGMNDAAADQFIALEEATERKRQADQAAAREREHRVLAFLRSRVFGGMHPTFDETDKSRSVPRFSGAEFAEVLGRCRKLGIRVGSLFHVSTDGETDRHVFGWLDSPEDVLRNWQQAGCNGVFFASYDVPVDLLGKSQ